MAKEEKSAFDSFEASFRALLAEACRRGDEPSADHEINEFPSSKFELQVKEALQAVSRVEDRHQLDDAERVLLRIHLLEDARSKASRPSLPTKAPECWVDRKGRQETPDMFVRRVYGPWLRQGLKRVHLLRLDKPLYTALGVWLHRHPDRFQEFDE